MNAALRPVMRGVGAPPDFMKMVPLLRVFAAADLSHWLNADPRTEEAH